MTSPSPLLRFGALPLVIAHRGASAHAPENTSPAFAAAWAAGAQWIETDVQVSIDGVPVLIHDDTADRTAGAPGPIGSFTAAELAQLDAGSWFHESFAGCPVPTLEHLLTKMPTGGQVLLEIKGPHTPAQLAAELAVIDSAGAADRVFLQSFETQALLDLRPLVGDSAVGLLVEHIHEDPVAACFRYGAISYNPDYQALLAAPQIVAQLHAEGISVLVYTCDEPDGWEALTAIGVDGIITNDPAALIAWQKGAVTTYAVAT
ncbi:glycerophosphodiester phosphodiesterase [Nakamurella antarctica]|uniref:glycerophosphodiester phosphodiesterase n=1 Tax=Nakamurella antarctica TaxID=1902245 RepID=UPI0013DDE8A4|nr:glycerophosphodiester phosphodiesterase family protein [Nakamurella antarctica]